MRSYNQIFYNTKIHVGIQTFINIFILKTTVNKKRKFSTNYLVVLTTSCLEYDILIINTTDDTTRKNE